MGHTALQAQQRVIWSLHHLSIGGRDLPFQVWYDPINTTDSDSVSDVKPDNSDLVIGYHVGVFTHTWSGEYFTAQSQIYPRFMGKVSTFTHSPLPFYTKLLGIWTGSRFHPLRFHWNTRTGCIPWWAWCHYFFLSLQGFLYSVSTLSDNSKQQLASSCKSHKLWCQAMALLLPVALLSKMPIFKLIHYFSSLQSTLGFWASCVLDNVTLNAAYKTDQSLSYFHTGTGAAVQTILEAEQHISSTSSDHWYCYLSTKFWRRGYPSIKSGWIISKIHDILDGAIFK